MEPRCQVTTFSSVQIILTILYFSSSVHFYADAADECDHFRKNKEPRDPAGYAIGTIKFQLSSKHPVNDAFKLCLIKPGYPCLGFRDGDWEERRFETSQFSSFMNVAIYEMLYPGAPPPGIPIKPIGIRGSRRRRRRSIEPEAAVQSRKKPDPDIIKKSHYANAYLVGKDLRVHNQIRLKWVCESGVCNPNLTCAEGPRNDTWVWVYTRSMATADKGVQHFRAESRMRFLTRLQTRARKKKKKKGNKKPTWWQRLRLMRRRKHERWWKENNEPEELPEERWKRQMEEKLYGKSSCQQVKAPTMFIVTSILLALSNLELVLLIRHIT